MDLGGRLGPVQDIIPLELLEYLVAYRKCASYESDPTNAVNVVTRVINNVFCSVSSSDLLGLLVLSTVPSFEVRREVLNLATAKAIGTDSLGTDICTICYWIDFFTSSSS
jgi:hypothetical protein